MTKLSQILPIEAEAKGQAEAQIEAARIAFGNRPDLDGYRRDYVKRDDTGEDRSPTTANVKVVGAEIMGEVGVALRRWLDLVALRDWANTRATASVVLNGEVLIADAPAPFLIWLANRLAELEARLLARLPILDASERWHPHPDEPGVWESQPTLTQSTAKTPQAMSIAPPTPHHKEQVHVFDVDRVVGTWTTVKVSGAFSAGEARAILGRLRALRDAVKMAREEANATEVAEDVPKVGAILMDYLMGGLR